MLDSIYHMTLRLLSNITSGVKSCVCNVVMDVILYMKCNLKTISGLSILMHGIISLPYATYKI